MTDKKDYRPIKVIGAGWGRTGTSSFKKAMDILNLGPCYHMVEVFANKDAAFWTRLADKKPYDFDEVFRGKYQSLCDLPACIYWKDILAKYPDAKVVLTTRSPESWYKSVTDTIYRFQPGGPFIKFGTRISQFLGLPTPGFAEMMSKLVDRGAHNYDYSKEGLVSWFKKRNESIVAECPKDKLLVFEAKDGWEPLCKFLDVPIPDVPYPHENDTANMQRIEMALNAVGYAALTLAVAAVVGLGYFAKAKFGGLGKDL
jgi:hypothetical protein